MREGNKIGGVQGGRKVSGALRNIVLQIVVDRMGIVVYGIPHVSYCAISQECLDADVYDHISLDLRRHEYQYALSKELLSSSWLNFNVG